MGLLNSNVAQTLLSMLNPTLSLQIGNISSIPYVKLEEETRNIIIQIVNENIKISKKEWDTSEISWDFKRHPLVDEGGNIKAEYTKWKHEMQKQLIYLKNNEDKLDEIFMEKYEVKVINNDNDNDDNARLKIESEEESVKSFISYAVGCMFGRYSLDQEGLMFAGGDMTDIYAYYGGTFADTANSSLDGKYTFGELGTPFYYLPIDGKEPLECWKVDGDNIIPITDEEYFTDDIVNRFAEFVKAVYGQDTLEENLDFIAQALGNKGASSREVIRNYFLRDFYTDHLKVYQKRPIYWLFDSGKRNGLKALIYMHRYNADTIGNLRVDYLHRMERIYESEMDRMQDMIDNSGNAREVTAASKRKEKLQKQLKECQEYDEKIGHLALSRIEIDLDDGVKVNYEKVQTARDGKKYQVLTKVF